MPCNIGSSIFEWTKSDSERKKKKTIEREQTHMDLILHGFDTI
jgi:hypothetical protein